MTRVVTIGYIISTVAGVGQDDGGLLQMRNVHFREFKDEIQKHENQESDEAESNEVESNEADGSDEAESDKVESDDVLFDGYHSSPKARRCKTQANKVFRLEALTAYNPLLNEESSFAKDLKEQRKEWKADFAADEVQAGTGGWLQETLQASILPHENNTLWWWRENGQGTQQIHKNNNLYEFSTDVARFNLQQSQTVCTVDAIRPALCMHLCDMIPECEAFGTFDTSDEFSKCCFNNMDESVLFEPISEWTQPSNKANWRCHRKNPKACPTDSCPTVEEQENGCEKNAHCSACPTSTCPGLEDLKNFCTVPPGMEEECSSQSECLLWSDDDALVDGSSELAAEFIANGYLAEHYYGNCRSGSTNADGVWEFAGNMKFWESGMAAHFLGKSIDSMEQEGGILADARPEWLAEAAKKNLWTVAELRAHVWTQEDLDNSAPPGVKQRPGCVRNITYAACKAEAGRLYKLGKDMDGVAAIDAFDFLWGRHKPTDAYQAFLDGGGQGADWNGTRFEGVTHAENLDIGGIQVLEYQELPEDLESACCLFKTPENQEMRGAAVNEQGKNLWQRKCTVCLA